MAVQSALTVEWQGLVHKYFMNEKTHYNHPFYTRSLYYIGTFYNIYVLWVCLMYLRPLCCMGLVCKQIHILHVSCVQSLQVEEPKQHLTQGHGIPEGVVPEIGLLCEV